MSPRRPPVGPRLRRPGIRARIAGGSFVIALVFCLVAGLVVDHRIQVILRDSTVAVLASDAAPYVESLHREPGEDVDQPGPSQLVAVIAPDGTRSPDTLPTTLPASLLTADAPARPEVTAVGSPATVVRREGVTTPDGVYTVVTARTAADEQATLLRMRLLLIAALAVIALGVLVSALVLTSAALRPVGRLRRSAEHLLESPGDELLPVGPAEDEIAHLARTLNALIGKLRASARRERQMVSDASHELRTPLTILRTRLELARTGERDAAELREDLAGAEASAARLSALVDSLLELSRIEAGEAEPASAAALVAEVQDAVDRAVFRAAGGDVEVLAEEDLHPSTAVFDLAPQDLGRIVDNLVSNALRAVGGSGRITVGLRLREDSLRLTVADTGGGMPEDFLPRALDRFSQGDASRAHGSGAGLGLAIVAAIVEGAGGTIALENLPGEGLVVRIDLPGRATA